MAFVIPPVKPVSPPEKQQNSSGGFAVKPMDYQEPEPSDDGKIVFNKGDKVTTIIRTQAYDPYSNENFYLAAHTPGKVVPAQDQRRSLKDTVTIIITSFDNGNGRIAQVLASDLVKAD